MRKQLFYLEFILKKKDKTEYVHKELVSAYYLTHAICLIMEIYGVDRDHITVARQATQADMGRDNSRRVLNFDFRVSMLGWWQHVAV